MVVVMELGGGVVAVEFSGGVWCDGIGWWGIDVDGMGRWVGGVDEMGRWGCGVVV